MRDDTVHVYFALNTCIFKHHKLLHMNTDAKLSFDDLFHPFIIGIEAGLSLFQSDTVQDKEGLRPIKKQH